MSDVTSDLNLQSNNSASSTASDLAQNSDSTQNAEGDTAEAEDGLDAADPPDLLMASLGAQAIPVPTPAPLPTLALAADSVPAAQTLAQQATANIINVNSQTALLASTQNGVNRSGVQITTREGVIDTPAGADTDQQKGLVAPPPQNLSFFARLLQKQKARRAEAEKIQLTRTQSAATRDDNAPALPGVRNGNSLFGITSEEGADEERANIQVASVGSLGRMISNSGLVLQTENVEVDCLRPDLVQILKTVGRRFGKRVMVTSGFRSPDRNQRAGGVKNSTHVYCKAADIQVEGVSKWELAKYLRTIPDRGGVGTYCRTNSVHIDTGSQRDWHYPCRRVKSKATKSI